MSKNALIKGAFVLTITGLLTRFIGFFFRIFLSQSFGEEQMGLYQLIFPLYALCYSFASAGIETSLCRLVAKNSSSGKAKDCHFLLYTALIISVSLSLVLAVLLHKNANFLSHHVLNEPRCKNLITTVVWSLPFASVHSCICGYYLGKKQIKLSSISQFLEQLVRVGTVYIAYNLMTASGLVPTIQLAVLGIVAGEMLSSFFCFQYYRALSHQKHPFSFLHDGPFFAKQLCTLAIPLTSTRVITNIFQSVETISIPIFLQKYGYTNSESLRTYGVLTGMALPCILFPSAITNALSTMLLPTVAEIEMESNLTRLKSLIRRVIFFGFGFGSFCGIFFLLLGPLIGQILFHNQLSGDFLRTLAWLCPFLYMNSTLVSILNGLGKANQSFLINMLSLALRITGVWWGILHYGMNGYLWGLLFSQLLVSFLCLFSFNNYIYNREIN